MAEQEKKNACSVSQAVNIAKRGLEQIRLTVVGEVSESVKEYEKIIYFDIKDEDAVMSCIIWKSSVQMCGLELRAGMLVQVTGVFTCHVAKGRMQFNVRKIELAGEGILRMQVAQLTEKLRVEGLMDTRRKRPIPQLPNRVAIITSGRGAAVHDCIRTLRRRNPMVELQMFCVTVEGQAAPSNMCEALMRAQSCQPAPDAILLVRGGGSYEDLMPFNDEGLARCIAACSIPVVTGIGHEPDHPIADMVADACCVTPTAAAERVTVLDMAALYQKLTNAQRMLNDSYKSSVEKLHYNVRRLKDRPLWHDVHYLTGGYYQTLEHQEERLSNALPNALAADAAALSLLAQRLKSAIPDGLMRNKHELQLLTQRLKGCGMQAVERGNDQMALAAAKLDALSPLKTLSRGYSIAYAAGRSHVVKSVEGIEQGDTLAVRLKDGVLDCTVNTVERQN